MAWHYNLENSPSSPGLVEASWADTSLDGAPSALLSLLPTHGASCLQGNGTECSQPFRSGMTCEHSTASLGADTLTLSAEASPARISALPERVTDLTENGADYGPKWPGSLARYNPGTRSWRTAQCSLLGGLTEYSATFPRWGTMRSGELWERMTPVPRIAGNESGSWPTPKAIDGIVRHSQRWMEKKWNDGGDVDLTIAVKMNANTPSGNWPTPTCADAFTDKLKSAQQSEGSMHSVNLSQAVKMWPTPCASDNRDRGNMSDPAIQRRIEIGKQVGLSMAVKEEKGGGQLNPDWVEWLMNWPIGWTSMEPLSPDRFLAWLRAFPNVPTASKPSETDKCQQPQSWHGEPCTTG